MPPLEASLRRQLEKSVIEARTEAESAARALLATYAFAEENAFDSMDQEARDLRSGLRRKARAYGGGTGNPALRAGTDELIEEIAFEAWHRMLFSRFLAENDLLMHPAGAPVTIEECEELAAEERQRDGSDVDGWDLAARYASAMLPGVFSLTSPAAKAATLLAPEGKLALEKIVSGLSCHVFTADDAFGWVYQFWQSEKKDEVNASGRKIGGADIAPVTQLFTEHYMVRFLLENSLGAWWAARHPDSPLLKEFEYLRFRDDDTPAAGTFPGWPAHAAEVTVMDPCCGSGHFLVEALDMLTKMRMEEEGLDVRAAGDAVLRDNLFGLEIDERCTELAAFALAFAAWKQGGYRKIPTPNIACSGIPVKGQWEAWKRLARGDTRLEETLLRLYQLYKDAPDLGSLIDPNAVVSHDPLFATDYAEVAPLIEKTLAREAANDPAASVFGDTMTGIARANELLAGRYTLIATNVPFLGRGYQASVLTKHCDEHYPDTKYDLAAAFMERCRSFCVRDGSYALVTPHNWRFIRRYVRFRKRFLSEQQWDLMVNLGANSFRTSGGFNIGLSIYTDRLPSNGHTIAALDVSNVDQVEDKDQALRERGISVLIQVDQLKNPNSIVTFEELAVGTQLEEFATAYSGLHGGDRPRFVRYFWEVQSLGDDWEYFQNTVSFTQLYGGRSEIVLWEQERGALYRLAESVKHLNHAAQNWRSGHRSWGKHGVTVSQMGDLNSTLYLGDRYGHTCCAIVPEDQSLVPAIWAFCSSDEYAPAVRQINQHIRVSPKALIEVQFDVERWQKVAEEQYPDGLPEPCSDDPTQWLFEGHPKESTDPLQVGVARLLGYQWPEQELDPSTGSGQAIDELCDQDGIVTLSATADERPAAERLRALLAAAWGVGWSPSVEAGLLADVGYANKTLEEWLRDGFFAQHVKLFHNRPFIWQIWDGRKDGFSVLVNYHKLDSQKLDRLIYTTLGRWIQQQRAQRDAEEPGAEARLAAALELETKLKAIRQGEAPYDIYVRWKPIHEQPIGWDPDLNDGVRLNIRPWIEPFGKPSNSPLRSRVGVSWKKDRGRDPDGSERFNDKHLTLAEKRAAREEQAADD